MKRMILAVTTAVVFTTSAYCSTMYNSSDDTVSSNSASLSFNADFVSRYLWRGLPLCSNPSIQPYGSIEYKGFSLGAWSSYGVSTQYAEVDLFLSYTLSNFTITLNDYFNEDENDYSVFDYFDWKNSTSPHILEGMLTYEGPETFPLSFTIGTFFYGADKDTADNSNLYSTYIELGYSTQVGETPIKFFIGGTPQKGYYSDNDGAIVNLGITLSKELKLNDNLTIPVNASLIINPDKQDAFFIVGFTL